MGNWCARTSVQQPWSKRQQNEELHPTPNARLQLQDHSPPARSVRATTGQSRFPEGGSCLQQLVLRARWAGGTAQHGQSRGKCTRRNRFIGRDSPADGCQEGKAFPGQTGCGMPRSDRCHPQRRDHLAAIETADELASQGRRSTDHLPPLCPRRQPSSRQQPGWEETSQEMQLDGGFPRDLHVVALERTRAIVTVPRRARGSSGAKLQGERTWTAKGSRSTKCPGQMHANHGGSSKD